MKDNETLANMLFNELERGTAKHPHKLVLTVMARLVAARAAEIPSTADSIDEDDYEARTGKLCLQTAVLAIRMIRDNDLEPAPPATPAT